ncbi:MAG: folylpolyglutamate synthase/dihydrofolate synthase family protein [Candidatus Zixiibacteriota bacterium]
MTYRDATARLLSLEHWGIKLGLANIGAFCRRLGEPQTRYLTIHVAGTNGKGSTSAYLDAILRAAGYRVGRYTSPHLRDFRERIHVDGRPVSRTWVAEFVAAHWSWIRRRRISFFEATTALAFDAFARAGIDIAVVEVGLGGRFDATNVVPSALSIITRIARDHEQILGHTPGKIAFEKAGIIKPGVPVLTGPLHPDANNRVRGIAARRGAPIWTAAEILRDAAAILPRDGERWRTPLAGSHQNTNLAVALAGVTLLKAQGVSVSHEAARLGVAQAHWPARFQIVAGPPTVVYDAAHNLDGMKAVRATWRHVFGSRRPVCVFTTRIDKEYAGMVSVLSLLARHWIGCPLPGAPGIPRAGMERLARRHRLAMTWRDSVAAAMNAARALAGPDGHVLVVGSHYLVGAVIPAHLVEGEGAQNDPGTPVTRRDLLAAARATGPDF